MFCAGPPPRGIDDHARGRQSHAGVTHSKGPVAVSHLLCRPRLSSIARASSVTARIWNAQRRWQRRSTRQYDQGQHDPDVREGADKFGLDVDPVDL